MPWTRIGSGLLAGLIAFVIVVSGGWFFTLGIAVMVYLGQSEYFRMVEAKGMKPAKWPTLVMSQVLLLVSHVNPDWAEAIFPISGSLICFYLLFLPKLSSIADISASVMGLFYCGYLPGFWIRLRDLGQVPNLPLGGYLPPLDWLKHLPQLPQGLTMCFVSILCVVAADIGAYAFGKRLGRTPLSHISPKKTTEGSIGGLFSSILIATIGSWVLQWPGSLWSGMLLGVIVGVTSLLGDLTESMMKRDAGFKDSGDLIPGHGGILDRTDSYLFTAPLIYYFTTMLLPWIGQFG
jgi:phosphatidate cytidylyltransferase